MSKRTHETVPRGGGGGRSGDAGVFHNRVMCSVCYRWKLKLVEYKTADTTDHNDWSQSAMVELSVAKVLLGVCYH